MTRRNLVSALAVGSIATASRAAKPETHKEWTPRLGVLGPYSPNNVAWAKEQGFTNMILGSGPGRRSTLDASRISDSEVEQVKSVLKQHGMHVSALQVGGDSINPNMDERKRSNDYFVKAIELAGKLGVPYIGTQAGKNTAKSFEAQVDEIVRVYNETFFKACEANKVRILWEPYPEAANLAISPVAFAALFKAFGDSPYVGLQFDPSHFVRQFMDPIQTARDFVDKIYDVHLKDTEIMWPVLRAGGINPVNDARWWRYRIPGMGTVNWREFFTVLQDVGYSGGMSIEQEDPLYGADNNPGPDFSDEFKIGYVMGKRYLNQYVP
jgi:sugar phosphate isomerase/epimerase